MEKYVLLLVLNIKIFTGSMQIEALLILHI